MNIGHGTLGFTLAMGSAELAADLNRQPPELHRDGALFRLADDLGAEAVPWFAVVRFGQHVH